MSAVQQGWLVGHSPYTLWAGTQGSGEEQIVGFSQAMVSPSRPLVGKRRQCREVGGKADCLASHFEI